MIWIQYVCKDKYKCISGSIGLFTSKVTEKRIKDVLVIWVHLLCRKNSKGKKAKGGHRSTSESISHHPLERDGPSIALFQSLWKKNRNVRFLFSFFLLVHAFLFFAFHPIVLDVRGNGEIRSIQKKSGFSQISRIKDGCVYVSIA